MNHKKCKRCGKFHHKNRSNTEKEVMNEFMEESNYLHDEEEIADTQIIPLPLPVPFPLFWGNPIFPYGGGPFWGWGGGGWGGWNRGWGGGWGGWHGGNWNRRWDGGGRRGGWRR